MLDNPPSFPSQGWLTLPQSSSPCERSWTCGSEAQTAFIEACSAEYVGYKTSQNWNRLTVCLKANTRATLNGRTSHRKRIVSTALRLAGPPLLCSSSVHVSWAEMSLKSLVWRRGSFSYNKRLAHSPVYVHFLTRHKLLHKFESYLGLFLLMFDIHAAHRWPSK